MEIKINVDNIDYDALADLMMPMLMDYFSNDKDDVMTRLLLLSQGFTEATVHKILSKMSQQKKDVLMAKLINNNKPRIMEMITKMAVSQGIRLSVTDVEARQ